MTKLRDFRGGSYLKAADLGDRVARVVIESIEAETVGDGDRKLVARFEGKSKALILNDTNLEVIELRCGPDTADAIGSHWDLFVDSEVRYAGKKVGGIRLRSPKVKEKAAPPSATQDYLDDEVPGF
jgi:hypothetical protein